MKLEIYNSIINGDLRPYIKPNTEEEYFTKKLNFSIKGPIKPDMFLKKLKEFIDNNPAIEESDNYFLESTEGDNIYEISTSKSRISEELINIDIPPCFNDTTNYYHYLINNESNRIIKELSDEILSAKNDDDIKFILRQMYLSLERLLKQTSIEIRSLPVDHNDMPVYFMEKEDNNISLLHMNVHHIFYTLKVILLQLYNDIYRTYPRLSENISKTEEEIYINILNEKPPLISVTRLNSNHGIVSPEAFFDINIINSKAIIKNFSFNESKIFDLIFKLHENIQINKKNKDLQNAIIALENKIIIYNHCDNKEKYTYKELHSFQLSDKFFKKLKHKYKKQLEEFSYGYERMEIIDDLNNSFRLPSVDDNQINSLLKYSIYRRIYKWFELQKSIYKEHLTETFPTTLSDIIVHETNSTPLPKHNKADISSHKSIARKHLHFLSGYNIQDEKIMTDNDYNKLLKYVDHLIENDELPDNITKIPNTGVSNGMIRYTFYLIHKELYTTISIKTAWIDFLMAVFFQFDSTSYITTKTKFSTKPSNYNHDMKNMLE